MELAEVVGTRLDGGAALLAGDCPCFREWLEWLRRTVDVDGDLASSFESLCPIASRTASNVLCKGH